MRRKPSGGGREPPSSAEPAGYGRPPKHAQFKPGQSGNPAGRPKGRRNLKSELLDELNELVEITEKGEKKTVTKQRALIKSFVAKAASGDARILSMIIDKLLTIDITLDPSEDTGITLDEEAILKRHGVDLGAPTVARENPDE